MIPARSCSISRAEPGTLAVSVELVADVSVGEGTGEGDEEGMVWATVRKKSSMYWREAGSYLCRS